MGFTVNILQHSISAANTVL